jgi:hypothetical protein
LDAPSRNATTSPSTLNSPLQKGTGGELSPPARYFTPTISAGLEWWRAARILRNIRHCQSGDVGIAVSAMNRLRRRYPGKPRQQCFRLRMPRHPIQLDRNVGFGNPSSTSPSSRLFWHYPLGDSHHGVALFTNGSLNVSVDLPVSFCVCRFYVCHPHRSDPAYSCAPPSGAPGREVEESRQTLVPRRGIALLL